MPFFCDQRASSESRGGRNTGPPKRITTVPGTKKKTTRSPSLPPPSSLRQMASYVAFTLASEHSTEVSPDMTPEQLAHAVTKAVRARIVNRLIPLLTLLTRPRSEDAERDPYNAYVTERDPYNAYVTAIDIRAIADLRESRGLSAMECAYLTYLVAPVPPPLSADNAAGANASIARAAALYNSSQLPQPWKTVAMLCNLNPDEFADLFPYKETASDAFNVAEDLTLYIYLKKCVAPLFASDAAPKALAPLYRRLGKQLIQHITQLTSAKDSSVKPKVPNALTGLFAGVVLASAGSRVK